MAEAKKYTLEELVLLKREKCRESFGILSNGSG